MDGGSIGADGTPGAEDVPVVGPGAPGEEPPAKERELVPLLAPAGGVPEVVTSQRQLQQAVEAIAGGTGPVAVDAERASGYRYGQRAYLVQLRRAGAGTWLIDPMACPDLASLDAVLKDQEWVLHAATQDLPCLADVGLRPTRLFDTELGARLVGLPRVGLAAVVEHYLGLSLAKEHSAVDWSTRPLPEPWLRYATLDVEVLVELRDAIAADLDQQGKATWAQQEFDALTRFAGPPPRVDPWRRTSGMHRVRNRRGAALVRELWLERERVAADRDVAPGRVLPDQALVELALTPPGASVELPKGKASRLLLRYQQHWLAALKRGQSLPDSALPPLTTPSEGPPPARAWADRDPAAAAALARARTALGAFADDHALPVENLLTPDTLRRVLWQPPVPADPESVAAALRERGAREWQVHIAAPILVEALNAPSELAP
jgi:ribonuclease D